MKNKYELWLNNTKDVKELQDELVSIKNNPQEIEDRFYRDLAFGTGGLRGVIGAGTNRMNIFTVMRATAGLGSYMIKSSAKKSVVIAYDSRNMSKEFAHSAAKILSSFEITAYIFDTLMPTPVLSYAVRELNAGAGIVITASHNPKKYNGYKVYNENGCQITDVAAAEILAEINSKEYFESFEAKDEYVKLIGDDVLNSYLDTISKLSLYDKTSEFAPNVVYTPLHGTGNIPVRKILDMIGAKNVTVVKEQELPDPTFDTCPYPNPEEKSALALALEYGTKYEADIVIATDPDADRVGIAVRDSNGDFRLLNGNETGLLLMDYMLMQKKANGTLGENPTVIKTIVSSDMAFSVAKKYGASVKEVLTGFKYIGEQMDITDNYIMGMEESYGYLVGPHARDKDAVSAVMMIVEMCAYYKSIGVSMYDKLSELYKDHGYYLTDLVSMTYPGASGAEKMREIIASVRNNPELKSEFGPFEFTDFGIGVDGLPKSDVLRFKNDTVRVLIRPSGTEPKMKIYYQIAAKDIAKATDVLNRVKNEVEKFLNQ